MTNTQLQNARKIRTAEKAHYLATSAFPDAAERWERYEQGIMDKYLPSQRRLLHHEHALDLAWVWRERRAITKNN